MEEREPKTLCTPPQEGNDTGREGVGHPKGQVCAEGGQSSQRLGYRTLSLNWEERKEQTIYIKVEIKFKWRECWYPDEGGWNPVR